MEQQAMSDQDIDRLRVIRDTLEHKLTWDIAATHLGLSARQVGRLCAAVRAGGNAGIVHKLRGRPSNNQLPSGLLRKALSIVKARFPDFGPTFANEKLLTIYGIKLSVATLRKGMIAAGIHHPRRRKDMHRSWRQRRSCIGELVQLDGSDHDWFEGRGHRCVLLVYIDDASSRILYAEFITVEDTANLLRCTRSYLQANGRPIAFYVDKDSIYKVNRQATVEEELRDAHPLTQFTRAMKELGIAVIPANSPQAKGRVERGFKTHQDRLVKELRLRGIRTMAEANRYLSAEYIPAHNERYGVAPANGNDAHRGVRCGLKLDSIMSIRTERVLNNDYTIRHGNRWYQVLAGQRVRPGAKITVEQQLDGSRHLKCREVELRFKVLEERPWHGHYAMKKAAAGIIVAKSSVPGKDHPWRRAWKAVKEYRATT